MYLNMRFVTKLLLILVSGFFFACSNKDLPGKQEPPVGVDPSDLDPWVPDVDTTGPVTKIVTFPELYSSDRFGKDLVYEANQLEKKEGTYTSAKDYTGNEISLGYTFLAPADDTLGKRPFVMLVHEGAFLFGNRSNEMGKAESLARRGYAVAVIDYRLGFEGPGCGGNMKQVLEAVYRSTQDIHSALSFFLNEQNSFALDSNQVFLGGSSAGAIATSAAIYMKEPDFEKLIPGITSGLGPVRDPKLGPEVKIRAQLTYLGYTIFETGYANGTKACPTLFFQNSGDNVLPFEYGPIFSCDRYIWAYGARALANRLKSIKAPYELNFENRREHNMHFSDTYIADRYALFIKRLWDGDYRYVENEGFENRLDEAL